MNKQIKIIQIIKYIHTYNSRNKRIILEENHSYPTGVKIIYLFSPISQSSPNHPPTRTAREQCSIN